MNTALATDINTKGITYTYNHVGIKYHFGKKSFRTGGIDCSGYVRLLVNHMYMNNKLTQIVDTYAANQIHRTLKYRVELKNAKPGMLIGARYLDVPSFAKNRFKKISHVGVILEIKGKLVVAQSAKTIGGVGFTSLSDFLLGVDEVFIIDIKKITKKKE